MNRRIRKYGLTDFGQIQIPPLPQFIVMIDRADQHTPNLLTHLGTPGSLVFVVGFDIPSTSEKVTYGPFAGPYLNGNIRLFVSADTLQGEIVTDGSGVFNQRILTRRGNETTMLEISAPLTWKPGDPFIFTEITL